MCKYCEDNEAIWFKKKNVYEGTTGEYYGDDKVLGAIFDLETKDFFRNKAYLSIEKGNSDWLDIRIKYCPFCGKKLLRKTFSRTIKEIISYYLTKKAEINIEKRKQKCSICNKTIQLDENNSVIIEDDGEVYHSECKDKR